MLKHQKERERVLSRLPKGGQRYSLIGGGLYGC